MLRNLTATLTYIFKRKRDIDNRSSALTTKRGLLATSFQNVMKFGLQTASNWTAILTHPTYILLSTSLPGFADGDQQTELNQTLQNGKIALTNCCRTVGVVPPGKIWGQETFTFVRFSTIWTLNGEYLLNET